MFHDPTLQKIAERFEPHTLYAVGGSVRNAILKIPPSDIDLAGEPIPEEVMRLAGDGLTVKPVNPRVGTLLLALDGKEYEYTTFRRDNYDISGNTGHGFAGKAARGIEAENSMPNGAGRYAVCRGIEEENSVPNGAEIRGIEASDFKKGQHVPNEVVFTNDIAEDALRRDFTVNALYYDLKNKRVIDPTGGTEDIKNRILRTCAAPEKTLGEDGLRLMRLVRFAAEYGFEIERETYAAAVAHSDLICDISGERIRGELVKILESDESGARRKDAPYRGLKLLSDIGVLGRIVSEFQDCVGYEQTAKYHKYDVFTHTLYTVANAPKEIRLSALFHDIGKPPCFREHGNMHDHAAYSVEIAKKRLGQDGLKFPIAVVRHTLELIRHHMFDIDGKTSTNKVRLFLQENESIALDLAELKRADYAAKGVVGDECDSAEKMKRIFYDMKKEGIPFSVGELKINGNDLKRAGGTGAEIGRALKGVLRACATEKGLGTYEEQLKRAVMLLKIES
ncbi:MAG: CCA tRNA nucleotidyltransferase [Clostridiales bacterium]|nr:CCA tRNA nucleotidyltransferase [Clostridiales bacterium]